MYLHLILLVPTLAPVPAVQSAAAAPASGATNILNCVNSLKDANGGGCLQASSQPTQGRLFPYPGLNNDATGGLSVVPGGFENIASAFASVVSGGVENIASGEYGTVGGGKNHTASGAFATVGGGRSNTASYYYATVGGGQTNTASGASATVGGGKNHTATGDYATVGGGAYNTAPGTSATVGGGQTNTASGAFASLGGGGGNAAVGFAATVGGGTLNTASGVSSTVSGGRYCVASGYSSLAAGFRAKANHDGSFVWGDSVSSVDKTSSADDEFNVYAEGGLRMFAVGQTVPSMVVDPAGRVGIGVPGPLPSSFFFEVKSSEDKGLRIFDFDGALVGAWINDGQAGATVRHASSAGTWTTGQTEDNDFIINGNGNVGIGTTTPSEKLQVVGNICATGSIGACSDERYKESIEPLEDALEDVLALRGVSFDWKADEFPEHAFTDERQVGFIAQEVLETVPEIVAQGSDGYYSVDYAKLTPLLVEAVKEQNARIDDLLQGNAEMRARIAELESLDDELAALKATILTAVETE